MRGRRPFERRGRSGRPVGLADLDALMDEVTAAGKNGVRVAALTPGSSSHTGAAS